MDGEVAKGNSSYSVPLFGSSGLHNEEDEAKGWRNPAQVRGSISVCVCERERERERERE